MFRYISQCYNNRNKVHSKCNALDSSLNHPLSSVCGKIVSRNQSLMAKRLGTSAAEGILLPSQQCGHADKWKGYYAFTLRNLKEIAGRKPCTMFCYSSWGPFLKQPSETLFCFSFLNSQHLHPDLLHWGRPVKCADLL